ncbi:hypothetical protein [Streptomyces sp. SP17KL33]|uniref:hypothetical protein n=1 Tax=Streptomyces sp. SP17KL33 TaxID=3002534 RepID=UPI002E792D0A|nr:hypothetical protein [Streptomyces sp. SP17KL33]MEE1835770.1 hypothetical protein [Streptomyces sp. SP17KL33]
MKFTRVTEYGQTHYSAEGETYRYTAERDGKVWRLRIWKLETIGDIDPIRVAKSGPAYEDDQHDTLTLCKAVAAEFEALGDGYKSSEHGHRERMTEATIRAYENDTQLGNFLGELQTDEATAKVATSGPNGGPEGEDEDMSKTYAERMEAAEFVQVGAGKTPHIKGDDGKVTACGKAPKNALDRPEDMGKVCKACRAIIARDYPLTAETPEIKSESGDSDVTETETAETPAETPAEPTETDEFKRDKVARLADAIRAKAEAGEDEEGAKALRDEAETIVVTLPAGQRNFLRRDLDAALRGEPTPAPEEAPAAAKKAVAKKAAPAPVESTDYTKNSAVVELVNMAAERIAEGVKAHQKASQTARSVAEVILDARLRLTNKQDTPDLKGASQAARDASAAIYKAAGGKLDGTDEEVKDAVFSMTQAVQYQMSDVLVGFIRALDNSPETYAEMFGKVKEAHPDLKPSEAVFAFYKLDSKSKLEKARERQAAKSELAAAAKIAITAGGGTVPEAPKPNGGEPIKTPGSNAKPETKPEEIAPERKPFVWAESLVNIAKDIDVTYFESLEDGEEKEDLELQLKAVQDKIKEALKALI